MCKRSKLPHQNPIDICCTAGISNDPNAMTEPSLLHCYLRAAFDCHLTRHNRRSTRLGSFRGTSRLPIIGVSNQTLVQLLLAMLAGCSLPRCGKVAPGSPYFRHTSGNASAVRRSTDGSPWNLSFCPRFQTHRYGPARPVFKVGDSLLAI